MSPTCWKMHFLASITRYLAIAITITWLNFAKVSALMHCGSRMNASSFGSKGQSSRSRWGQTLVSYCGGRRHTHRRLGRRSHLIGGQDTELVVKQGVELSKCGPRIDIQNIFSIMWTVFWRFYHLSLTFCMLPNIFDISTQMIENPISMQWTGFSLHPWHFIGLWAIFLLTGCRQDNFITLLNLPPKWPILCRVGR